MAHTVAEALHRVLIFFCNLISYIHAVVSGTSCITFMVHLNLYSNLRSGDTMLCQSTAAALNTMKLCLGHGNLEEWCCPHVFATILKLLLRSVFLVSIERKQYHLPRCYAPLKVAWVFKHSSIRKLA